MSKSSLSCFSVYSLSGLLSLATQGLNAQLTPGRCSSTNSSLGSFLDCGNADPVPQCVTLSQVRDCVADCSTGLDETCPTGLVKCDGCKCVQPASRISMCFDHTNDKLCSMFGDPIYNDLIYKCMNSDRCVLRKWLLDSEIDCPSGDDENECLIWPEISGCSTKVQIASTASFVTPTVSSAVSPTIGTSSVAEVVLTSPVPTILPTTSMTSVTSISLAPTAISTLPSSTTTSTTSQSTTVVTPSDTTTNAMVPTAISSTTPTTVVTTMSATSPVITTTSTTTSATAMSSVTSTLTSTSTTAPVSVYTSPTTTIQTSTLSPTQTTTTTAVITTTITVQQSTTTTSATTLPITTAGASTSSLTLTTTQLTSMAATSTTTFASTSLSTTASISGGSTTLTSFVPLTTSPAATSASPTLSSGSTSTTTAAATTASTTSILTTNITGVRSTATSTMIPITPTTTLPTSGAITNTDAASQTAATTLLSSTSSDTESSSNKITVAFLFDDSTALNTLLANISSAISNFAALMSPYEYDRLANYLLEVYTNTDSTLLGERFTGEDLLTLLNSFVESNGGQRPATGACAKTNLTNLYRAFSSILKKATKNCVIYWLPTSNTVSADAAALDLILSYLTTKQCRIDIILYDTGCFNQSLDTFDIFNKIARFTGGNVYRIAQSSSSAISQTTLDDLFAIFVIQAVQPRLLLEKSQRFAKSTSVRFSVDRILTDLLVVIQGCNLNFNLRDNRGIYIPGSSDPYNIGDFTPIVRNSQLCAFLITLNPIKNISVGPGPGVYLLDLNSSCSINYEIEASGRPDFKFYFIPKNSNFSYDRPIIGTETHVAAVNPDPGPGNSYFPNQLQFMDFTGIPFEGSLANRTTLITNSYLTISDASFYIKVSGIDPFGDRFQRYSRHPFYPEDISAHIQNTAECKGLFDCTAMGGPCLPFSVVHDCVYACPNGADEGCFTGTQKCGCTCIPDYATCPTNVPDAECLPIPNIEFFKCFSDGACIPLIFVGDGFKDCSDNSDEMAQNFDECSPNNHGFTANLCSKDAVCIKIPGYDYFCTCKAGFWGDGFSCALSPITVPPITATSATYFTKLPMLTTSSTTRFPITVTSVPIMTTTDVDPLWSALHSAKCPGQFDCGLGAGNCTTIKNYRDCKKDCPNGIDEACFHEYVHCDGCKCVLPGEAQTLCSDWKSDKFCSTFLTDSYTCKDGNGCIYVQWIMDGVKDCADGSDEDPKQWDLCKLGLLHCDATTMLCVGNASEGLSRCVCIPGVTYSKDGFKTCVPI